METSPCPTHKSIILHQFQNKTTRLPDTNLSFFTNSTGEVTLHLGALFYNQNANRSQDYYCIYVNGQIKGNLTSTGTCKTQLIAINVS